MAAKQTNITKHGNFQIATIPAESGGYIAWGKMGTIVTDCPLREPGEHVWFEFGNSRLEALNKLLNELGLPTC